MNTINPISIILVDDHSLYREGLCAVLRKIPNCSIKIIGQAGSGAELFQLLDAGKIPFLLILDIILPDINGVEIARKVKTLHPEIKIMMVSSEVSEELINELLDIGVDAYLSKMAHKEDIETALRAIYNGSQYYGNDVAKIMYDIYLAKTYTKSTRKSSFNPFKKSNPTNEPISLLTDQEDAIIRLLCKGLTAKEIAFNLDVSPRTIETHKSRILSKLGFKRTTDLIKYAIKNGITTV